MKLNRDKYEIMTRMAGELRWEVDEVGEGEDDYEENGRVAEGEGE